MAVATDVVREVMDSVEEFLKKMPQPIAEKIRIEMQNLRDLSVDARIPRLALVGRRGAGKSSLINAIFKEYVAETGEVTATTGQGRWFTVKGSFGELRLLDTRGLSEGTRPAEATSENPVDDIVAACKDEYPDAILFLAKAKEVDAHIHDDIHEVIAVRDRIAKDHSYSPPIIGVLAQVDELDPVDVNTPPYADQNKHANIAKAEETFRTHLSSHGINTKVFSTSAYSRFEGGQLVSSRHWQVEELLTYLAEQLPNDAQIAMARLARIKSVQKRVAKMLIRVGATMAGAVAATPLPVADMPLLTSIQIGMITGIGYVSGRKMDKAAASEFLSAMGMNVGAAFVLRETARAMVKFVFPAAGLAISSAIAAGATYAMGQAAVAYFIEGAPVGRAKELLQQAGGEVPSFKELVVNQVAAVTEMVTDKASTLRDTVTDKSAGIRDMMTDKAVAARHIMTDKTAAAREMVTDKTAAARQMVTENATLAKEIVTETVAAAREIVNDKVAAAKQNRVGEPTSAKEAVPNYGGAVGESTHLTPPHRN